MLGKPKRRKIDQYLQEYRKDPAIALSESTRLSNRLWRLLIGLVLTVLLVLLLLPLEPAKNWGQLVCLSTLVFLMNGLGWLVLLQLKPGLFDRPSDFNRFIILLVVVVLVSRGICMSGRSPFLVPVPILAMILTMCYGQTVALLVTVGMSFYVSLMSPNMRASDADKMVENARNFGDWSLDVGGLDYFFSALIRCDIVLALALALGGTAVVIGLKRVRQQSKPTVIGGFAGIVQAVAVLSFQFVDPRFSFEDGFALNRVHTLLVDPSFAFIGGMVSGALVTVFLPVIESLFDIVSERRLLALGDFNNELLRTLRNRAPGTYQHTLGVAQLSSNAAEAIGADPLLTQVGAYYHDIGKMVKPEYFVENMGQDKTIHSRLRPSMSKLIIISHVKEGVELALEAKLPEQIVDMIPMHHGTTVVEYFFHKSLEKGNGETKQAKQSQSDTEYRYPGPRPRFPEAGILMLSDAVEAIAKSMQDPNANRFKDMVRATIRKRLLDGQLDECKLTMRDLSRIEDSFVRTLTNMYHARIRYPSGEEPVGESAESGGARTAPDAGETPEGDEAPEGEKTALDKESKHDEPRVDAESGDSSAGDADRKQVLSNGAGGGGVGDVEQKQEAGSPVLGRDAV
jgi:putative nucleotidyltransferase with HDIG domain